MADFSNEVVTMSLFKYSGSSNRWWAFRQMGFQPPSLFTTPGLKQAKLLGSGAGNGFSIWPNFGVYALLAIWENEAAAKTFFANDQWWADNRARTTECYTVYMRAAVVHGEWGGEQPFELATEYDMATPVAVITRATIKLRHIPGFWRFVPTVSKKVKGKPGQRMSIGVGEWPLFMQATFSIWDSSKAMMDYAYNNPYHREVIQKTRELGWYKEELFARFLPYAEEGSWSDQQSFINSASPSPASAG
ncbi:MAG: hypothetical protein AAFR36_16835 [Bacteroidota bacterium]